MNYPSLLQPNTTEALLLEGQTVLIPKIELQLRPWQGEPIADSFNGKPLLDFAGRPTFAELAVYELFRLSGWDARWIEPFGAPAHAPKHFVNWSPTLPHTARSQQPQHPLADAQLLTKLQAIAAANGNTFAGCWDVLGWYGDRIIFAECKRRRKDKLRATQPRWLLAGLQTGLQPANFMMVEWDFMPGS